MKNIPFGTPLIGKKERSAVLNTLTQPILVHGPLVKEFEAQFKNFVQSQHAASVASCTAGLHLAYLTIGIKPGDEVIVAAQTHVATAHAVEYCGGKPVFIDSELSTGNIDITHIEESISEKTKAISVVHFLGFPVNMEAIQKLAHKHNLFIVEDCALGMGSYFKGIHVGNFGDFGCFSFYPVKHMTTVEGGMVTLQNKQLAQKLTTKRSFGLDRVVGERRTPGEYDVVDLGFNYRMNEMEASLGLEQLKKMKNFLKKRKKNFDFLYNKLKSIDEIELFAECDQNYQSSYYCLSFLLKKKFKAKRNSLIHELKLKGVGTSIYYPKPVPHMKYYQHKYGYGKSSFPCASRVSYSSIALPVGPHLTSENLEYIVKSLKAVLKNRG